MKYILVITLACILPFSASSQSGRDQEIELLKEKTKTLEARLDNLKLEIELLKALIKEQNTKMEKVLAGPAIGYGPQNSQQATSNQSYATPAPSSKPATNTAPAKAGGQCTATTQKGTRCSRQARSNGLCWQHGG